MGNNVFSLGQEIEKELNLGYKYYFVIDEENLMYIGYKYYQTELTYMGPEEWSFISGFSSIMITLKENTGLMIEKQDTNYTAKIYNEEEIIVSSSRDTIVNSIANLNHIVRSKRNEEQAKESGKIYEKRNNVVNFSGGHGK